MNNWCFEDTKKTMPELKHFFFRTLLDWISILRCHSLRLIIDLIDLCNLHTKRTMLELKHFFFIRTDIGQGGTTKSDIKSNII